MIKKISLILCLVAVSHEARTQNAETGQLLDKIVAVVNDGVVLQSELDNQIRTLVQRLSEANQQLPPEDVLKDQILERLIVNQLQLQRAERMG
ncbi:MAG: SurA N-terminal domain-containing protein, partial [Pseudomonadota bacterium]